MTEAQVSLRFDKARVELDKLDDQVKGAKTRIIQDLAKDLEKLLPIATIAEEIVSRLKGKVGKTLVYRALDKKYKSAQRVKAQKKPKKKNLSSQVNLAEANPSLSTAKPVIQVAATGESVTIGSPPGEKHIERKQAELLGQKPEHSPFEKDLLQQNFQLLAENRDLKEPFDYTVTVILGKYKVPVRCHVRPALKEISRAEVVDEAGVPAGLFA